MVIVKLMGGLGNQMFQYATALRLASARGAKCKLDLSFLSDCQAGANFTPRQLDLIVFNRPLLTASATEVRRFRRLLDPGSRSIVERISDRFSGRRVHLEKDLRFDASVLDLPKETYLEGFFQNEGYFQDREEEIRNFFELAGTEKELDAATRSMGKEIRERQGICMHVRRGDYVSNPETREHHGFCSEPYYLDGLAQLRSRGAGGRVYIFSDDPEWCRTTFTDANVFTVVGPEHGGRRASGHLWLMTLCHHFIISNSSFGWWAAWLSRSEGKLVVCPSRWFRAPALQSLDICPPAWIRVSNESV